MATSKKTASKAGASSKAVAAERPQRFKLGANDPAATKAINSAIKRALDVKQLPPGTRFPIFCGIWLNPITREFELINQVEDIRQ